MAMVDQVKMHVEELGQSGSKRDVVLLHGWGQSSLALKPLGELLAPHLRVHLVDLPGFGQSENPNGVWSSFDYAERLVGYFKEKGLHKVDLVGHSFGGKVAMSLASRYPGGVGRLVLMSSSGLRPRWSFGRRCRLKALRWLGKGIKGIDAVMHTQIFARWFATRYGSADYKNAGSLRPILVKAVNDDLSEAIRDLELPALILWGERDTETPVEVAHRLHALLPSSTLRVFPGKGHWLCEDVGAHLCASYILPFLLETRV